MNRVLFHAGWAYVAGAGILPAMVTESELQREWVPFAWAALGLIGLLAKLTVPVQDVIGAVATFIAGSIANTYGSKATVPIALTIVTFYASEFLVRERYSRLLYSILGTTLLTLLLFREAEGRLLQWLSESKGPHWVAGMYASERVPPPLSGWFCFCFVSATPSSTTCGNSTRLAAFCRSSASACCC